MGHRLSGNRTISADPASAATFLSAGSSRTAGLVLDYGGKEQNLLAVMVDVMLARRKPADADDEYWQQKRNNLLYAFQVVQPETYDDLVFVYACNRGWADMKSYADEYVRRKAG